MKYTKRLTGLTAFYGQASSVFPIIVAAPQYFAGQIPLGVLMQTAGAFGEVQSSLSWFIDSYAQLAAWKATLDRLTGFRDAIAKAKTAARTEQAFDRTDSPRGLVLEGVDVRAAERPGADRERQPDGRAGRRGGGARRLGQRQDHAVPGAGGAMAVRPRTRRHCPRMRASSSCRRSPTCRSARCARC